MFNILPIFICFVIVLGASILPAAAEPPAAKEPFKLPGLVINAEKRCVDVDATVCLEQGALELIACTKDSKEHESVVVVEALPVHIHTALLLLGARNGNPAMRRPINKEQTLWADVPPRGDPIDVFLEFKDAEGKAVERPIGDFIMRSDEDGDAPADERAGGFSSTFIFAGSQLHGEKDGPKKYLADVTGNVISISTFGDELLCLPDIQSHENGALMWQINSDLLPKLGTKVILRLCLKKQPEMPAEP